MAGLSGIVFSLRVAVLERLQGQPFDGLNYEKESGVIKTGFPDLSTKTKHYVSHFQQYRSSNFNVVVWS